jgi:membrane protein DedA with SNARE-associated domain
MLEKIIEIFKNLLIVSGPLGITTGTFTAVVIVIIPCEVILITAGSLTPDWITLFWYSIFATIGGYLGGLVYYYIGYRSKDFAYSFIDKYGKWILLDRAKVEYAEQEFSKRGKMFVFWGRFFPGIKSIISIPAGIARMDLLTYSLYTIPGVHLWYSFLLILGFIFKNEINYVFDLISKYDKVAYVVLALILVLYVWKYLKNNKSKNNE